MPSHNHLFIQRSSPALLITSLDMGARGSYVNLSKGDILYELCSQRYPFLKEWESEAGYAACKKFREMSTAAPSPLLLHLQSDCATHLGYMDEADLLDLNNRFLPLRLQENTSLLEEENNQNTSNQPRNEDIQNNMKKNNKKKHLDPRTHRFLLLQTIRRNLKRNNGLSLSDGFELLPSENQQKQTAPGFVSVSLFDSVAAANKYGGRSVCLCVSKSTVGFSFSYNDWYVLDLIKKKYNIIFGKQEWEGILTREFCVASEGSIIYIHRCFRAGSNPGRTSCSDIFCLDVYHPLKGWTVGPRLPYPHVHPVATSMNGTVYIFNGKCIFNGKDMFAMALDTSDSKSDWKPLVVSPNVELSSTLYFLSAIPDPARNRILLFAMDRGFFAYYPGKQDLVCIHSELKVSPKLITTAWAVVDDVLYFNMFDYDELLGAYDLDQHKMLTPVFSSKVHFVPCDSWRQLLDLGGGECCLVEQLLDEVLLLKLKVKKEAGGDRVYIAAVSFDRFSIPNGSRFVCSVAI